MKSTAILPVTVATALLLGGCGSEPVPIEPADPDPAVVRPAPDSPHVNDLAQGINDAGYRIFHAAAAESDDDVVLSPLSIGLAFGMLDVGATDNLAVVLEELFGLPAEGEERWAAFNTLEQTLARESEEGSDGSDTPTVRIANRAFQDLEFTPVEGYNENILQWFGAGIESLPLRENPSGSLDHINTWVEERTEGLIPELLDGDAISDDTIMVLVNTLYMKAAWATPFEENFTEDADFTLLDGTAVTVPLMREGQFDGNAVAGDGFSAIDLPYYGSGLSMLVIAPDAGNFGDIEARLGSDFVSEIDSMLEEKTIDFALPRFESEGDIDLGDVLEESMGVEGLFNVTELKGLHPQAYLSAALHSAKVIVDEEGTEAAAGTALITGLFSGPPPPDLTIRVDNPFLYVIRDHEAGAVLFVGRVLDPA